VPGDAPAGALPNTWLTSYEPGLNTGGGGGNGAGGGDGATPEKAPQQKLDLVCVPGIFQTVQQRVCRRQTLGSIRGGGGIDTSNA
jgi:hypothetical protein